MEEKPNKKRIPPVMIRFNEQQREELKLKSEEAGFNGSIGRFVKAVALKKRIKSRMDAKITIDLMKLNGDMGRLGGLLKLALSDKEQKNKIDLINLLRDLKKNQDLLRQYLNKLR